MDRISKDNFRLTAAYLLPGITVLWSLGWHMPTIASWLATSEGDVPTVGSFLYLTFGSLAAGLTVSTIRWATIDTLHHWTGLQPPKWDFSLMNEHLSTYHLLETNHYHYYQWHANMLVALCFAALARHWDNCCSVPDKIDVAMLLFAAVLFVGSRDTLRKYYTRVSMLLAISDGDKPPSKPKPHPKSKLPRPRKSRRQSKRQRAESYKSDTSPPVR